MRLAEHEQKKGADEERNGGSEEREREPGGPSMDSFLLIVSIEI